eukprot:TRINITY_DN16103_c0_g2_i1.p1 TRINITY_DN16103_c0_g2~~TRINITY_DN16103_c0_g2_i1.p1  ORF type:complete len:615 (+),score=98.66 TRINITY_DN16103_c0_g2_i1:73-1845(+)
MVVGQAAEPRRRPLWRIPDPWEDAGRVFWSSAASSSSSSSSSASSPSLPAPFSDMFPESRVTSSAGTAAGGMTLPSPSAFPSSAIVTPSSADRVPALSTTPWAEDVESATPSARMLELPAALFPPRPSPSLVDPPSSFYVERVRVGMEPTRCNFCQASFVLGRLRVGYMAAAPSMSAGAYRGRNPPFPQAAARWVHATPCVAKLKVSVQPLVERVGFSHGISVGERESVLRELAKLAALSRQHQETVYPRATSAERSGDGRLALRTWEYMPARMQVWATTTIPDPSILRPPPPPTYLAPPAPPPPGPSAAALAARAALRAARSGAPGDASSFGSGSSNGNRSAGADFYGGHAEIQTHAELPGEEANYAQLQRVLEQLLSGAQAVVVDARRGGDASGHKHRHDAALSMLAAAPVQTLDTRASEDCVVCREPMEIGDECRRLPCLHLFHKQCIDQWFQVKATCPLDNMRLEEMLCRERTMVNGESARSRSRTPPPRSRSRRSPTRRRGSREASRAISIQTRSRSLSPAPRSVGNGRGSRGEVWRHGRLETGGRRGRSQRNAMARSRSRRGRQQSSVRSRSPHRRESQEPVFL